MIVCTRWDEGQSASLACGLAELADCEAVVVTLGDQPRLSAEAIRRVIDARGEGVDAARATYGGAPGAPGAAGAHLFDRMRDVTGDHGARNLLMSVHTVEVPCDDLGGGEDVDTPAQLDALRAAMKLEHSFQVNAPLQTVWERLIDVRAGGALPAGRGDHRGRRRRQLPRHVLGAARPDDRGLPRRARDGRGRRGGAPGGHARVRAGQARAGLREGVDRLADERIEGRDEVEVETDFTITGRLARFGRGGMIQDVSNRLLRDFSDCLQKSIEAAPRLGWGAAG